MFPKPFHGLRILIVEDNYLLAQEFYDQLSDAGATVLNPAVCVNDAMRLIRAEPLDLVLLDIGLGQETSFPIADELVELNIPFVFISAYPVGTLPARFADALFLPKTATPPVVAALIDFAVARNQAMRIRARSNRA